MRGASFDRARIVAPLAGGSRWVPDLFSIEKFKHIRQPEEHTRSHHGLPQHIQRGGGSGYVGAGVLLIFLDAVPCDCQVVGDLWDAAGNLYAVDAPMLSRRNRAGSRRQGCPYLARIAGEPDNRTALTVDIPLVCRLDVHVVPHVALFAQS